MTTEKKRKPRVAKTPEQKLADLIAQQKDLQAQIARQKKLSAEREQRAIDDKLKQAGLAVQRAGLLDLPIEELDRRLASLSKSTSAPTPETP